MTLANENSRFFMFFNDFWHSFTTCQNTMNSILYRSYEKKLTIPNDSAHRNILHSDNQQSQKVGFPIQVKPNSKRRRMSDMEESRYNTVWWLKTLLNPRDAHNFPIVKTISKERRYMGCREAYLMFCCLYRSISNTYGVYFHTKCESFCLRTFFVWLAFYALTVSNYNATCIFTQYVYPTFWASNSRLTADFTNHSYGDSLPATACFIS